MKLSTHTPRRKAAGAKRPLVLSELSLAERHILNRYDVSPSLARAIAHLAMLGGRK